MLKRWVNGFVPIGEFLGPWAAETQQRPPRGKVAYLSGIFLGDRFAIQVTSTDMSLGSTPKS